MKRNDNVRTVVFGSTASADVVVLSTSAQVDIDAF